MLFSKTVSTDLEVLGLSRECGTFFLFDDQLVLHLLNRIRQCEHGLYTYTRDINASVIPSKSYQPEMFSPALRLCSFPAAL